MLWWFVLDHFCCSSNLTETARDLLSYKTPDFYKRLETPKGVHFEMETIFSYKARALLEDTKYGMWVGAVIERVLLFAVALLYEMYEE